jgi:hypothetical protein
MFPVYEEKSWKALLASVDADTVYTAASTSTYYKPSAKSTAAFAAAQGTATNAGYLIFVAHEVPRNKLHMMFSYAAT